MRCSHHGCACDVADGERYCGDICREHGEAADHEEHACDCGHAACAGADLSGTG